MRSIEIGEKNPAFTTSNGDMSDSTSKYIISNDSKHPQQMDHNHNQEHATISVYCLIISIVYYISFSEVSLD